LDEKYYVTGIGEVLEGSLSGPSEQLTLAEVVG
jgi:hypothetical protein